MGLLYNNFKESSIIFKNFIKWFLLSILSGCIVGVVISLFLKSLQLATDTRKHNPFIITVCYLFLILLFNRLI